MDDHKLLLLEVASYNTSGKTNPRVLVEYNDHLNFIDKNYQAQVDRHSGCFKTLEWNSKCKAFSDATNQRSNSKLVVENLVSKFKNKFISQKLHFHMKTSICEVIMLQDPPSNLQFNLLLYFEDFDLSFSLK